MCKGKNTHTALRSGQQLVIQFVETKLSICFHELNHKLLAAPSRSAPLYVCFYPNTYCSFTATIAARKRLSVRFVRRPTVPVLLIPLSVNEFSPFI